MKALLVATRNRGKQPELRALLAPLGVTLHFPDDLGLAEVRLDINCLGQAAERKAQVIAYCTR